MRLLRDLHKYYFEVDLCASSNKAKSNVARTSEIALYRAEIQWHLNSGSALFMHTSRSSIAHCL